MNHGKHRMRVAGFKLRLLAALTLLLAGWLGAVTSVSAQGYSSVVIGALTCDDANSCWNEIGAQFSVTTHDGEFLGSCTVTGDRDASNFVEACLVEFPFDATGILIVTEDVSTITPGYTPEANPIFVDTNASPATRPSHDAVFRNVPIGGNVSAVQTSDIAIVTTENGQSVTDACYVLTTFGNVGCDDNGDGKITFRDVPLGTYTVHQTADLGSGRSVADFTISVTGTMDADGWERFDAAVVSSGASNGSSSTTGVTAQEYANGGPWQLGIQARTQGAEYPGHTLGAHFTVTSESGAYIGECELESIAQNPVWTSCIVDVPSDTVSLVWEDLDSIPSGLVPAENPIRFDPTTYIVVPHGIGASFVNVPIAGDTGGSSADASAESTGTRDIALITRDPDDGHLVTDGCYILLEYGNAACDENGDGQITYAEIPFGTYTVHQTQTPSGYPTAPDFLIEVDGTYPGVPLGYVVRQATQQVSLGSRNVSVVFVDSRTHAKVESSICVELVGGTQPACDDALVDGQIDFLDVPAGTYPIKFTGLPTNWQILTGDMIGPVTTIESSPGKPSIQFVYVEVYVPDSASTTSASGSGNSSISSGSAGSSARTWTADVWVRLCDAPPNSGRESHCSGGAGVVVNISLASGEFLGSCTTGNPYITPGGYTISTCAVAGLPFNANFVATQDLSTIPAGYAPASDTVTFSIGNDHGSLQFPQDVDGRRPDVDFINLPANAGPLTSSGSSGSTGATLLMTFRGCPEGFDPTVDDYFANCTIPLDAPDASYISWGEGGSAKHITELERQYDGAYIFDASPYQMSVALSGLAPVVRDAYQVIGSDSTNGYVYIIGLANGEIREVFIFYYFYP